MREQMGSEENVVVKVVNESTNPLPEYKTNGSAAMDVQAYVPDGDRIVRIKPGERKLIRTGLKVEIPEGYEIQVKPRSGLALKEGITVLNSPGVIDSDYRGELGIIIYNTSDKEYHVMHSERIAQISLYPIYRVKWEPVTVLSDTERGSGGFGSTGKN